MKKTTDKATLAAAEAAYNAEADEKKAKRAKEAARADIVAKMDALGVDELQAGNYIIKRSKSTRNGLDTTRLKRERPEIAAEYNRESTVNRFDINKR